MLQGNKIVVGLQMPLSPEVLRCLHNAYRPPALATSALEQGLAWRCGKLTLFTN
jgi:hypothetical protein